MDPLDRRTFLKGVAATAAVAAVPPAALLAADPARPPAGTTPSVWKKTPCRLCGVGCGLLVAIQNGRAVAVKGDPESPVSRGLACVRGYHSVQALYGRDRITRALVRRNGALGAVPMTDALDLVARKLREARERGGRDGIALYGSAQWTLGDAYVASKLFRGALGTRNVDTSARLYTASGRAGLLSTFGLDGAVGCYDDIEHADIFVLWDHNMAETEPVLFSRILKRRRTDPGVRIIDLTTRTTRTSYAADRSLVYAPHSELAIANALCREIVVRRWVSRDFVERHVAFKRGSTTRGDRAPTGGIVTEDAVDTTWVEYVRFLESYTPERAEQLSGLRAEDIRWLASLYGDRSRKVMSVWGTSVNQHARGTWLNNALYNVHLLVGKVGVPGSGPLCVAGQPGAGGGIHDAGALTESLPRGLASGGSDRRLAARVWGVPAESIDARHANDALSLFHGVERGDIGFLWIQGTNPMASMPDLNRYRKAARKDGCFIVVSEAYPTPTTDIADVVLPAAMWIEREGIFGSADRRTQHFEQMVAPPGDAMSDARQMIEVARRLGFGALFRWPDERHLDAIWEEYARFHEDPRWRPAPLAELRARPGVMWPYVDGRETKWRYNAAHDATADARRGGFDFYGHPDHRAWIWLRPYEQPAESPSREYPFWLDTGRVIEHWGTGSMTRRIPTLHRAAPRAYVEMHRADAEKLGIRNGERVRLASPRGTLQLEARIDYRSQPARGRLFVPTFDEERPVNELTLDVRCPLSGQPEYGPCAVRVERLAPGVAT